MVLVKMNLEEGDVITSKKGIPCMSEITGNVYLVKKAKIMPNGGYEAIKKVRQHEKEI